MGLIRKVTMLLFAVTLLLSSAMVVFADDGSILVTAWDFMDADRNGIELTAQNDGTLTIAHGGATTLSSDEVVALLPATATVSIVDGESTEQISLGWSSDEYIADDSGNYPIKGQYLFTAQLPDGYELSDGVDEITITVLLGDSEYAPTMSFLPLLLGASPTSVYVNGVALTSGQYLPSDSKATQDSTPNSGGYAYFDGSKLILQNFTCACTTPYGTLSDIIIRDPKAAIFSSSDLEIVLAGTSTVSAVNSNGIAAAICVDGDLTFSGSGSANFIGTTKNKDNYLSYGICSTGRVSFIGSGVVKVSSGRAENSNYTEAYGIYCDG